MNNEDLKYLIKKIPTYICLKCKGEYVKYKDNYNPSLGMYDYFFIWGLKHKTKELCEYVESTNNPKLLNELEIKLRTFTEWFEINKEVIKDKDIIEANAIFLTWLEILGVTASPPKKNKKTKVEELTEREKKYYERAITNGMAEKTEEGYKWLYNNGSKASLAYFLYKVFNPNSTGQIPYKRLNKLWNVTRLDSSMTNMLDARQPQKWRPAIDILFTN